MTALGWGQAWWIETPHAGRRPAVVLTRPEALDVVPLILTAIATTHRRHLVSEVQLDADDGFPRPCVLNLDTPELVPRSLFVEFITHVSELKMREVCRALVAATGCART